MRVTQSMLAGNSLRHISQGFNKMGKLQEQLSTGKKITRPSDDPVVAMKGMYYRTNLTEVQQYKRNLSEAYAWMEESEAAIEQGSNVLSRVRELLVQGMNGTLADEDKNAIASEVGQLKEALVQVANTQFTGRYIFNGTAINEPRVTDGTDPSTVKDLNEPFMIEVSKGIKLQANIDANNVFNEELFTIMNQIEQGLKGDDSVDLGAFLGRLDNQIDSMNAERSELGARYNRLEMIDDRLAYQEYVATRVLSDNEDAHLEEVITDLITAESVHRAALGVGARIIQPSLLDFLR
ncbi:flagellar hook-associated protein FlgL [Sutcliffiella cohnii]|uniref:flagellar hook-associated protein FlgL n=1 Tax=Sutcliffiella cohnii TaxID=33932 RepID=UPI002E22C40C|nr:flagellar hook-associated protein FlgL [Sutcliffiella cohnii]MED4019130.1 flagellar hook-associated protein FlgL [Sutcliffiella cohnii]